VTRVTFQKLDEGGHLPEYTPLPHGMPEYLGIGIGT